ncbi:MAG TPA: hypothetical protein VFN10_04625 [Thermoanaerobaculia bacterium]|nr:hypothetical protein [Thermoanaerobaculia bacterium]
MGFARVEERPVTILEEGTISFYYRPRVETQQPEELGDVQRILAVLTPADESRFRLLAMGRKQLPTRGRRERFWGFVDAVLHDHRDMDALLAAHTYNTKTRGLRHLPAAKLVAIGSYTLTSHDDHSHLEYTLHENVWRDPVVREIAIESSASWIVSVANPDPTAWGLVEVPPLQQQLFGEEEVHITIPTPFPPELQTRFRDRRYAQLDTVEWLDHPGAELVFISE